MEADGGCAPSMVRSCHWSCLLLHLSEIPLKTSALWDGAFLSPKARPAVGLGCSGDVQGGKVSLAHGQPSALSPPAHPGSCIASRWRLK